MTDNKTLLIVDDDPVSRAILAEIFQDQYAITEAETGRQAIDILTREGAPKPSALLLDYMLPEMDGLEVLRYLKDRRLLTNVPVFLITAESSNDIALNAFTSGVEDIISKPVNSTAIVKKHVQNVVQLYQSKNNLERLISEQIGIIQEQSRKLKESHIAIIDMLCTVIEFRSGESGLHVSRIRMVTKFILEFAQKNFDNVNYTDSEIEVIANAAAMHDIGKLSVPDAVLNKPDRLTPIEFEQMKKHTLYGCNILDQIPFFGNHELYKYCYEICRHHHERYDGRGYPDGLIGDDIPLYTQIVSLADVYDALVNERVYKKAYSHEQAKKMILNGECGIFGDIVLTCFERVADMLHETLYVNHAS